VTDAAVAALEEARRMTARTGDAPVMPAGTDPTRCMSTGWAYRFWCRAETRAGLEPKHGRGWHSLRRKFASDLMDQPLKVLCQLGGWKNPQTVLTCYQRPDAGQLRTALEGRIRVRG
jgi:integrase